MKIEAEINLKYKTKEYSEIIYKTLDVDNEGFVDSKISDEEIKFNIKSNSLGSFLLTTDDLITSEILVENLINKITEKNK